MKKYIPIDFDEKGKVILGREKNTPTPNKGIPAIFIESGSDEGKQGLKSISISPAIQTTPALDSLFPIYWDDLPTNPSLPDGIKQYNVHLSGGFMEEAVYKATFTPTADWYVLSNGKGEPAVVDGYVEDGNLIFETTVAETTEGSPTGGVQRIAIFISIGA